MTTEDREKNEIAATQYSARYFGKYDSDCIERGQADLSKAAPTAVPELAGLRPDERHRVWRAGFWKAHCHWQVWAVVVSYGFLISIGAYMGALVGSQTIGMLVAAGVCGFLYSVVVTDHARPYFRSYAALYPDGSSERPHSD